MPGSMRIVRMLCALRTRPKLPITITIILLLITSLWNSINFSATVPQISASLILVNDKTPLPVQLVTTIAIGGGITSRKVEDITVDNIASKFVFFTTLVPSFCQTLLERDSLQLSYQFYLAHDDSDPAFSQPAIRNAFVIVFRDLIKDKCPRGTTVGIHLVRCNHHGRPAWAQNDAMLEAYLDGADYFYRINDDTVLVTAAWTEAFISVLAVFAPRNVGVVGPTHDTGNLAILTYDFVHRTHIEVFGFYYPRIFTDWYADDWITGVYAPQHVVKLTDIKVQHQSSLGRRYFYDAAKHNILYSQLNHYRQVLARYIYHVNHAETVSTAGGTKIIAMSLYINKPRYIWGAIRNAQLAKVVFPDWKVRFYIAAKSLIGVDPVPPRVVDRLRSLGAEVIPLDSGRTKLGPEWWSYLTADDLNVDYFLIRHPDARLSDRDAAAVSEWVTDGTRMAAVHCIRDHTSHLVRPITDGLWGARPRLLRPLLNNLLFSSVIAHFLETRRSNGTFGDVDLNSFLSEILFPVVKNGSIICHDILSNSIWPHSVKFPVYRYHLFDVVGIKHDQYEQVLSRGQFLEGAHIEESADEEKVGRMKSPKLEFIV